MAAISVAIACAVGGEMQNVEFLMVGVQIQIPWIGYVCGDQVVWQVENNEHWYLHYKVLVSQI